MSEEKTVTMKEEELKKVIDAKLEDQKKEYAEKHKAEVEEMEAKNQKAIDEAIKKNEANRKSIEETGYRLTGDKATDKEFIEAKLYKSEKLDGDKLSDWDNDFRKTSDRLAIISGIYKEAKKADQVADTKTAKQYKRLLEKAGYDGTTGDGLEWQPTILSSRLVEFIEAAPDFTIPNLFERINMTSLTFEIPREESGVTAYKGSVGGTPTESHATSGKATFTAQKIIAYTNIYYEAEEDMIVSAMPLIERRLVKGITKGTSDAIINGDNGTTHMDSNVTADTDRRKLFDGLRRICQTNSWTYDVSGAWTQEKFRKFQNSLAIEFGLAWNDLAFIFGKDSYNQVRNLAEVRTKEKFGESATVVRGVLQAIDGINVHPTSLVSDAVSSDGTVHSTAADNVKGQALVVYKPAFGLGIRRNMLLETDKNIKTQNIDVVASMRIDFQSLIKTSASGDPECVTQAINITPW